MKNVFLKMLFCLGVLNINALAATPKQAEKAKDNKESTISGSVDFIFGYNDSKFSTETQQTLQNSNLRQINTGEVGAKQVKPFVFLDGSVLYKNLTSVDGGGGFKYGIIAEAAFNSIDSKNPIYISEASIIASDEVRGTRLFGIQKPVTSKIAVNSTSLSPISQGVAGKWQNFLKYPYYIADTNLSEGSSSFITKPYLPIQSGFSSTYFNTTSESGIGIQPQEKWGSSLLGVSYISSRVEGFRFGVSYIPENRTNLLFNKDDLTDLKNIQNINSNSYTEYFLTTQERESFLRNIFAVGANYYTDLKGIELSFSAGFEHGVAVSNVYDKRNLNAYSLGLNLGYLGFTLGGSYINYGKSLQVKSELESGLASVIIGNNAFYDNSGLEYSANGSYVFDIGLGYAVDRYNTSISFLKSDFVNNVFWAGVFSLEIKATKNLANYLQIARYQFSASNGESVAGTGKKTSGFVLVFGSKYLF